MKSLIELGKLMDESRDKLNLAIKNNESKDEILKKSVELDEIIAEYINAEHYFETEKEKIINRQGDIINAPFKDEIIDQIKCDVLKRYKGITSKELEHFSTNVYIYAVLFAHNVDKLKVGAILNNLNCLYVEKWQEDGIVKDTVINEATTDYFKSIHKKYLEIIKEKLQ